LRFLRGFVLGASVVLTAMHFTLMRAAAAVVLGQGGRQEECAYGKEDALNLHLGRRSVLWASW
jgi:hypothetical protein